MTPQKNISGAATGCNVYKQVLNCIVTELCKMVDDVGLKLRKNISFLKIKCYLF